MVKLLYVTYNFSFSHPCQLLISRHTYRVGSCQVLFVSHKNHYSVRMDLGCVDIPHQWTSLQQYHRLYDQCVY